MAQNEFIKYSKAVQLKTHDVKGSVILIVSLVLFVALYHYFPGKYMWWEILVFLASLLGVMQMSRFGLIQVFMWDVIATFAIVILMIAGRVPNTEAICLLFAFIAIDWTSLFVVTMRFEQYEIDAELYQRPPRVSKAWIKKALLYVSRIMLRIEVLFQSLMVPLVTLMYVLTILAMIIAYTGVYANSMLIPGNALVYTGASMPSGHLTFPGGLNVVSPVSGDVLYFSATTFFTVGYGDIVPLGNAMKMAAVSEMFVSHLTMAILLVFLINRLSRIGPKIRGQRINVAESNLNSVKT